MEFKDYYATLGVESAATAEAIKRAYRKLARKYHPDVSREPDAEAKFKELVEAYEVLKNPEKRAAYDDVVQQQRQGGGFKAAPGWDSGFEFSGRGESGHSDFFESLFGRHAAESARTRPGDDHHAKIMIALQDAFLGAHRTVSLRVPRLDAQGQLRMQDRQLEVNIPKGIRAGQHLRLSGQGSPGVNGSPAGDLYLEIGFAPHPRFRLEEADVYLDVPVAPWEAALGAGITIPTPAGRVIRLTVPSGMSATRKLRLKGLGLPGVPAGDLYAVLSIVLPSADSEPAREAWRLLAAAFPDFNPRLALEPS